MPQQSNNSKGNKINIRWNQTIFTDHAVGLVLRRTKKHPLRHLQMLSKGGPCLHWGAAQTKRTDETKWRNVEVYIFPANIDACILPPFHFIISVTFFPHLLWASVEITGEISVCGRACLSSRGKRGKGVGRLRRRGKRDSCFAVLLCCLWSALFPLCVWR